jgi:nitrogen regulatory protein PII
METSNPPVSTAKTIGAAKLITAILPIGQGAELVKKLKEEKAIIAANANHARGVGRMTPLKYRGVGEQSEKDMVSVVVPEAQAEEIFEYIYRSQEIDTPHSGILYMRSLSAATLFELPEDLEEEK